ncbi:MAG: DUF3488 domain-containing protein [Proteobacteria bacterium]|nr:DUF3488 domain-containing protein [Pseudomonadota bacterium]
MKWLFYFIILICVLSATVSGICSLETLAVVCASLVLGAIFEWRKIHLKWLNRVLGIAMFIGLMAIHAMHIDSLHAMILGMFLNILWTVFCYRAISHEKSADRIQVGVLAIIPLACVAFALEAIELVLFLTAYFIVLLTYFASLSMAEPTTGSVAIVQQQIRRFPQKQFWLSLAGAISLAFMAAAILFLTIPRYGAEAKSSVPGVEQGKGIFPDVELDKTGEINLDPSLLFRAQVPEGEDAYYWRIDIQNRFDGTRWHSFIPFGGRENGGSYHGSKQAYEGEPSYELLFVKEWRDSRIPTLEGTKLIAVQDDENNEMYSFGRDKSGTWRRYRWKDNTPPLLKLNYWHNDKADSNAIYIPRPVTDYYAQKLRFDLSRHIASGFHPRYMWPFRRREKPLENQMFALLDTILDGTENERQIADKIQAYLKQNYRYSLNRPQRDGYVVIDFLFNQQYGHCEVFSTTMAVLLALKGIPVRNVTGFVSSETRDGMNMVRAAHAHSWVEAWIDGEWVRYDPTPTGAQTVELTLIRRIDDWFSTYQASDLYTWLIKYWQIILAILLMSAVVSVPVIVVRRRIMFLLSPTAEVYEKCWAKIIATCENRDVVRRFAKLSLGDWWEYEHLMPKMQAFAREYIRFRYAGKEDDTTSQTVFQRFRNNYRIVRQSREVIRTCQTIRLDFKENSS